MSKNTSNNHSAPPSDLVIMGRLGRPYGIRGWLRVEVYTEYLDSLLEFKSWWISSSDPKIDVVPSSLSWVLLPIEDGKVYQDGLVVKLHGVDTPEQAKNWGRFSVAVPRSQFPETEEDAEYWADLVGLSVFDTHGVLLGIVDHLLETGAHDVLCIHGVRGEQLIPYTDPFLKHVDLKTRQIVVDWEWVAD